jgi:uncharacterized protein HemX
MSESMSEDNAGRQAESDTESVQKSVQKPVTHPNAIRAATQTGAPEPVDSPAAVRTKALIAVGIALLVAVGGWIGLNQAADRGIRRLAAIDKVRGQCTQAWAAARTRTDTLLVDRIALPDTIDPRSDQALARCGDLRKLEPAAPPNNREMSGEPMPRGLR